LRSGDDREQQGQHQLGWPVLPSTLRPPQRTPQLAAQTNLFAETRHQHHAAEVRQVRLVERKPQCFQAFGHRMRTAVRFLHPVGQRVGAGDMK
jgi:hypothetical protein